MKTYTDELTPIESSVSVYKAANWYEREVSYWMWWTHLWAGVAELIEITGYSAAPHPVLAVMAGCLSASFF